MMDPATKILDSWEWSYAPQDLPSKQELSRRIVETARNEELVTYSDLVQGVRFHLSTVNDGVPFEIDPYAWTELHRAILGDFLGAIAGDSYREHGFLASAVAVSKESRTPSRPFFHWARELGLLHDDTEMGRLAFWNEHLTRAYATYAAPLS